MLSYGNTMLFSTNRDKMAWIVLQTFLMSGDFLTNGLS